MVIAPGVVIVTIMVHVQQLGIGRKIWIMKELEVSIRKGLEVGTIVTDVSRRGRSRGSSPSICQSCYGTRRVPCVMCILHADSYRCPTCKGKRWVRCPDCDGEDGDGRVRGEVWNRDLVVE